MNGTILAPKVLSCSVDEAKNIAAENALMHLGVQLSVPTIQMNEFYTPSNMPPQSQASLYQGRPLSAAHGVNLNGQPASASTINNNNSNNNSNSASSGSLITSAPPVPPNAATRPQLLPDFVPALMPSYFFDPTSKS